ncbi:MAG: glycosyltransferase, partial [Terriglobales bacterium]
LQRQGHAVTYWARAGAGQERYLRPLARLCARIFYGDSARLRWRGDQPAAACLEDLLAGERFDAAIISHWHWNVWSCAEQYLPLLRQWAPTTRVVVLSEDHHGLREERLAALTGHWADRERARNYAARELDVYRRADLVWGVSSADRASLLRRDPGLKIEVLPPLAEPAPPGPDWAGREGLVFLGEYSNPANRDGVDWFLGAIWPQVRERLPEVRLHLVGSHLTDSYARQPGIVADGFAPELGPVFARHRLAICPIRFGTGITTKNLAALRFGLPFVTTNCGAEGMDLRDGETALIADEPAVFADAVVRAYQDRALWERLAAQGRTHAAEQFSSARLAARMQETLAQVMAAPAQPGLALTPASPLWVETQYPEVLSHQPSHQRVALRARRYLDLAAREMAAGRREAARQQCGHALCLAHDPADPWRAEIQSWLERFGDTAPAPRRRAGRLELSVLIPTHNRRATLEQCLAALAARMQETLDQVMAAPAQPGLALTPASPLWVETEYPEVLSHQPSHQRVAWRARRYLDLAAREMAAGRQEAARQQCGHALCLARDPADPWRAEIRSWLERLEDTAPAPRRRAGRLELSVLIPTHNRHATLEQCLAALAAQTLAMEQFEVIVVDDGSEDDTAAWCAGWRAPFAFRFARQDAAGAGAARRRAVEMARGERVLLINDDSILASDSLAVHLEAGRRRDGQRLAVLGDFAAAESARRRALAFAVGTQTVLFPHPTLRPGERLGYLGCMTCNLSLPRVAVLAAGNFDPAFPVAEDTELGVRLEDRGWGVIYEPAARATHEHGPFTAADFVARARRYGPAQLRLHRKHPRLLGDGSGRLGGLDAATREAMRVAVERSSGQIAEYVRAIAAFDDRDFEPYFSRWMGLHTAADTVMAKFAQTLLPVHWHYVYASLLAAWEELPPAAEPRRALAIAAAGARA